MNPEFSPEYIQAMRDRLENLVDGVIITTAQIDNLEGKALWFRYVIYRYGQYEGEWGIQNEGSIPEFFMDLCKFGLNFHPDTDFSEYSWDTGGGCFSDDEANQLNKIMERCFAVQVDKDIYAIGLDVQNAFLYQDIKEDAAVSIALELIGLPDGVKIKHGCNQLLLDETEEAKLLVFLLNRCSQPQIQSA